MRKPRLYTVSQYGNIPSNVLELISKIQGQPVSAGTFFILDQEIDFLVVQCRIAHGNTTPSNKTAWLCSNTNGGNDWSVNFNVN